MRHLLATVGLLLPGAALAQTPLSPPTTPTQPQLGPQTPLAPPTTATQPQLAPQTPLKPQQPGTSVTQTQQPAEQPLRQTPPLAPPAPPTTRRPLSQPALTMDGGTGPSSTVSFPASPQGGAQPRRDGGTP